MSELAPIVEIRVVRYGHESKTQDGTTRFHTMREEILFRRSGDEWDRAEVVYKTDVDTQPLVVTTDGSKLSS